MTKRQQKGVGIQKGAQTHAEGEHGAKTHKAIMQQLQSSPREEPEAAILEQARRDAAAHGKSRLEEERLQRDLAEKGSEYVHKLK